MLKKYLYIFFISMVPLIELRGAIPCLLYTSDIYLQVIC